MGWANNLQQWHAGRKAAPNCRSTGGSASMSSLRSHSGGIVSGMKAFKGFL